MLGSPVYGLDCFSPEEGGLWDFRITIRDLQDEKVCHSKTCSGDVVDCHGYSVP